MLLIVIIQMHSELELKIIIMLYFTTRFQELKIWCHFSTLVKMGTTIMNQTTSN